MEFRVLGPLEVVQNGWAVEVRPAKLRTLLAVLLVRPNEVVSTDWLIDSLWDGEPPASAANTLQGYVSHLRNVLEPDRKGGDSRFVATRPTGYVLTVDPERVDAWQFEHLASAGRAAVARSENDVAATTLAEALALWRGPAFAEFTYQEFAKEVITRLNELRQTAIDDRIDARLALGHHHECVAELEALIAEDALRERRWGQLMVALYRCGRQADALRAYQRARSTLVDELGIDPGPALRRLEQAIIEQDPALEPSREAVAISPRSHAASRPFPPPLPPSMTDNDDAVFVGRREHTSRLAAAWRQACEGQRQTVIMRGDPGIGKTAMARVLAGTASESGGVVVYGRCDEELGVAYQPFAAALRWYVSQVPAGELDAQLGPLGPELVRIVPELAEQLPSLGPPVAAEPPVERYRLFEAVVSLLSGISARAPVLLIVDDLHWADKPTLLLLRHIVRSTVPLRLLLVAACRSAGPEVSAPLTNVVAELQREPGVSTLTLSGLDEEESLELMRTLGGQELDAVDAASVRALQAETGGNPLFMRQIARHLVETGALYREGGQWRLRGRLEDIELPEGVVGVIHERLSRLSRETMRVLTTAAVAGTTFTFDLLERVPDVSSGPDELLDALDEAVHAAVVAEVPSVRGGYTFAHALLRQVINQDLTAGRRARLHHQVARAYEALPAQGAHLAALAYHYAEAGITEPAADYALAAGRRAVSELAYEVAVALFERGLRALDEMPSPDRARRADLLLALADARRLAGDLVGAKAAAVQAVDDARAMGSARHLAAAAMLQTLGGLGVAGRADPAVGALCEEALAALGPDEEGLRIQVLSRLALHRAMWEGDGPAGETLAEQALALARREGTVEALQAALFARALTLAGSAQVEERWELGDELVGLATTTTDRRVLFRGVRIRALARLELGDVDGFDADLAWMEREASERHDWWRLSETARWRTLRVLLEGRFEEAEVCISQMLAHASGDPNAENARVAQLFLVRRDQGRTVELAALAEAALRRSPALVAFRALLALALLETGQTGEARQIFEELADGDFAAVPRDFTWPASLSLLTYVCVGLDDRERAAQLLELYRPHAGHLAVIGWGDVCAGAVDRFLAMLETLLEDWDAAESHFRAAVALEERIGSRPLLVRTRAWYAAAVARRDLPGDAALADQLRTQARTDADELGIPAALAVPSTALHATSR